MNTRKKIEVFSAGCSTCKETIELVKKIAGSSHEVVIHDMHKSDVASKAKGHGVKSVPVVVIDGTLADVVLAAARMSMSCGPRSPRRRRNGVFVQEGSLIVAVFTMAMFYASVCSASCAR